MQGFFMDDIVKKHSLDKEVKLKYWEDGPWIDEPDYAEFTHVGIECKIRRNFCWEGSHMDRLFGGHLCGYCRIPEPHSMYNITDIDDLDYDVNGGITYSGVESDGSHWIGFDCGHSFDIIPSVSKFKKDNLSHFEILEIEGGRSPTYKTFDFVISETKSLAEQIKGKSQLPPPKGRGL